MQIISFRCFRGKQLNFQCNEKTSQILIFFSILATKYFYPMSNKSCHFFTLRTRQPPSCLNFTFPVAKAPLHSWRAVERDKLESSRLKFAPYLFSLGNVSLFHPCSPVKRQPLTAAISHVALLIQITAFKRRACVSSCP